MNKITIRNPQFFQWKTSYCRYGHIHAPTLKTLTWIAAVMTEWNMRGTVSS